MARGALVDAVFEVEQSPTGSIDGGVTRGDAFHAGGHCAVTTGARFAIGCTGLAPSLRPLAQPQLGWVGKLVGLQGLHIFSRKMQARFQLRQRQAACGWRWRLRSGVSTHPPPSQHHENQPARLDHGAYTPCCGHRCERSNTHAIRSCSWARPPMFAASCL